jgi:citrate lyase beta subunit
MLRPPRRPTGRNVYVRHPRRCQTGAEGCPRTASLDTFAKVRHKVPATVADLTQLRSLLFTPGNDERKLAKALASEAHAVVCDLEDAVPPDEKNAARNVTRRALVTTGKGPDRPLRMVRINAVGTPYWEDDLCAVEELDLDAIVLPKATPETVEALGDDGPPLLSIVETAAGLRLAYETACRTRVAALALGAVDLGVELALEPREDGLEILYARSALVVDSAAAGIRAPFDVVRLDWHDEARLEAECRIARSLGFGGKLCIHPSQLLVVNRVFGPAAEDVAWAHRVLEAYDEGLSTGRGAVALDGQMIDLPVVERARRILTDSKGAR